MRLMNADRFVEEIQYYKREAGWGESWNRCLDAVLEAIQDAPTIAPEELPIVKELRANIVILEAAVNSNHNAEDMLTITKLLTETADLREKLEEKERACKLAIDKLDKVRRKLITAEKKLAERKPVVRAHWSRKEQRWGEVSYACSACGCVWYFTSGDPAKGFSARYCPDCGATMDKEFKQI